MRWLAVGIMMLAAFLLIVLLGWAGLAMAVVPFAVSVALLARLQLRMQPGVATSESTPWVPPTRPILTDWRATGSGPEERPDKGWMWFLWLDPCQLFFAVTMVAGLVIFVLTNPWTLAGIAAVVALWVWTARRRDPDETYVLYEGQLVIRTRRDRWRVIGIKDVAEVAWRPRPFNRPPSKLRVHLHSGGHVDIAPTEPEAFAEAIACLKESSWSQRSRADDKA